MCLDGSVQYALDLNRSIGTGDHAAVEVKLAWQISIVFHIPLTLSSA